MAEVGRQRVAIIGAGPTGISAARELIQAGLSVHLYDKEMSSGGLKRYGYPSFRMPTSVAEREAVQLAALGVTFHSRAELGSTLSLADLERNHDVVLLTTGAPLARKLGIPGEELPKVYDALRYLYCARIDQSLPMGSRVLVVGGGDTAIDAATTALLSGAHQAVIMFRRAEADLAAQPYEVKIAQDKGVQFRFWSVPKRINKSTKTDSLQVEIAHTNPPLHTADSTTDMAIEEFDNVIVAIGQDRDHAWLESLGLTVANDGTTNRPKVFVAGGSLYGSQRLAKAILDGRRAAKQILAAL